MWISRAILGLFAAVLVIAPVCVASSAPLTKANFFSTDPVSRLKRTVLRHSVVKTATAGMAALLLLTTSAHGEGGAGQDNVSSFAQEVVTESKKKRGDILSLYFGGGRNYMAESTGAYTTDIEGVEYERLGDYYGTSTTIAAMITSPVGGLGAHLGDTGIEMKFFFFGGVNRVETGEVFVSPRLFDKVFRDTGNMPNIIFAGTRQLFGINADKGFVGIGEEAMLTFHLGPSINIHPVLGNVNFRTPSLTTSYEFKNEDGNTDSWTEEKDQHVGNRPVGVGGHLGPGLLWQVNYDPYVSDYLGLGLSYVGSVSHRGSHTHLLLFRFALRGEH